MGVNNYTTKTCIDCGAVMENCGVARKRCPDCVKIWARIQSANAKARAKERARLDIVAPETTSAGPDKHCEGCFYYRGEYVNNKCCNYIFIRGTKRPCPPGEGCTVKEERQ